MKKLLLSLFAVVVAFSLIMGLAVPIFSQPQKGGVLPTISLPIPKNPDEKNYLGLPAAGSFKIPQIKAKVVLVQIFSMYCPYCQKDAPGLNELYEKIESDPDLKDKIKLIGIGAGNSPFEVETFKKTYKVPFPLFPDKDYVIHKACGEVRTPYYIGVKINPDQTHQIFLSQQGGFPGAEPFLEQILKETGLRQEK